MTGKQPIDFATVREQMYAEKIYILTCLENYKVWFFTEYWVSIFNKGAYLIEHNVKKKQLLLSLRKDTMGRLR